MNEFKHEQISKHVIRIIDITGVCCYLVVGSSRACLLDTCNGIGNIKKYVETLTDKPVFVILTHGHLDHMGGAGLFEEVFMDPKDLPVFKKHGDMEFRISDMMAHAKEPIEESDIVPTYAGQIKEIKDGDIFSCGDITIKMISVKGHTPGMMCPLIVEDHVIVFGDACGEAVLLFDEFSSDVREYKNSLKHLKEYEKYYDKIVRNHGSFYSSKELLDNVIECCDLILTGKDDHEPITLHGCQLYACHKLSGYEREDGKEGNIFYAAEKAK